MASTTILPRGVSVAGLNIGVVSGTIVVVEMEQGDVQEKALHVLHHLAEQVGVSGIIADAHVEPVLKPRTCVQTADVVN